ncbi:hypothetical protein CFC21_057437 [Triticum aestivum]|uniref:DUF4283 domain-containing protein n=2 Tax=Triticum aestivum TaxID=4565 RepID=A0A3B6IRR9_WHEAT|nr:uncharacterized protein LOC123091868 [Triticum aestivum]XP_044369410.1 uncharacterized protein LOC123091868 [Triticum aestivum]XP_044369411.1 uncharacterized protein LOC123091868 [Triticum aestivum]KAF7048739.1 hypothetical protein CFC21_057437 [Triticum aestivum]
MPRLGDPHSRPAMGRVVVPATPEMDVQADALTTNCVLISLGGDRRPASSSSVADALHKEFNIPLSMLTVVRHFPEDYLATFTHPHHRDDVVNRGNFRRDRLELHPKPWIMEAHAEHEDMKHHVQLSLEGVPLHAWNADTISRVIGVDCELDYVLPRSTRQEDARTLGIWAWATNPSAIPRVMHLTLPARRGPQRVPARGRCRLRYRVIVHLGLHEDFSNVRDDDSRANADINEFTWVHGIVDGDRVSTERREEPRDDSGHGWRRDEEDDDAARRGRDQDRDNRGSRWFGRSRSRASRDQARDRGGDQGRGGNEGREGRDGHRRRGAVVHSSTSPVRSPRGGSSRCTHPLDAARSISPTSVLPTPPSPVDAPTPASGIVLRIQAPLTPATVVATATPPRPPGFEQSPAQVTPPLVSGQPARRSPSPTGHTNDSLAPLFVQPEAPLLAGQPRAPPKSLANRRKTLAGVAIDTNPGFSLRRTTAHVKERHVAVPVTREAEKLVCRSLGIVQDGKDVTKDALEELSRRFQHELSPSVLSALCSLFKLDDEDATAIEDALISRGGQAAMDHAAVAGEATGEV